MSKLYLTIPALLAMAASASASIHGVNAVLNTLDGNGDRSIDSITFLGSPTVMTPARDLDFVDGNLTYGNNYYGWTGAAPRDMNTAGNTYPGNPDRADNSSPFGGEANNNGTLQEVFGVNNASHIIDGEGDGYKIDLFFGGGDVVQDDGDSSTVEFAVFERGWNSKLGVAGIWEDDAGMHYTDYVVLTPDDFTYAGWKLNTLEIDEDQKVVGLGISVESFGAPHDYIGFSLCSKESYEGPDIVAVRAQNNMIPAPASFALLGAAGLTIARRRR